MAERALFGAKLAVFGLCVNIIDLYAEFCMRYEEDYVFFGESYRFYPKKTCRLYCNGIDKKHFLTRSKSILLHEPIFFFTYSKNTGYIWAQGLYQDRFFWAKVVLLSAYRSTVEVLSCYQPVPNNTWCPCSCANIHMFFSLQNSLACICICICFGFACLTQIFFFEVCLSGHQVLK